MGFFLHLDDICPKLQVPRKRKSKAPNYFSRALRLHVLFLSNARMALFLVSGQYLWQVVMSGLHTRRREPYKPPIISMLRRTISKRNSYRSINYHTRVY